MPRKKLIRSKEFPYHVTARVNNRELFANDLLETWNVTSEALNEIYLCYGAKTHAFVLMPNHFHLLISTPNEDLGIVMQHFMRTVTKTLNRKIGRTGRVFGSRYHWSIITSENYFDCALKYVYRNPVKAEITRRAENYYFSSLRIISEQAVSKFPIHPIVGHETLIPNQRKKEFLDWINRAFRTEQYREIYLGFKKTTFVPARNGWKKGTPRLEIFTH